VANDSPQRELIAFPELEVLSNGYQIIAILGRMGLSLLPDFFNNRIIHHGAKPPNSLDEHSTGQIKPAANFENDCLVLGMFFL
jgi:hypothetical protein